MSEKRRCFSLSYGGRERRVSSDVKQTLRIWLKKKKKERKFHFSFDQPSLYLMTNKRGEEKCSLLSKAISLSDPRGCSPLPQAKQPRVENSYRKQRRSQGDWLTLRIDKVDQSITVYSSELPWSWGPINSSSTLPQIEDALKGSCKDRANRCLLLYIHQHAHTDML